MEKDSSPKHDPELIHLSNALSRIDPDLNAKDWAHLWSNVETKFGSFGDEAGNLVYLLSYVPNELIQFAVDLGIHIIAERECSNPSK